MRECGATGLRAWGAGCVRGFALVAGFREYARVVTASACVRACVCANVRICAAWKVSGPDMRAWKRHDAAICAGCACVHPARCRVRANMRPPGLCALCTACVRACEVSGRKMDTSAYVSELTLARCAHPARICAGQLSARLHVHPCESLGLCVVCACVCVVCAWCGAKA